MPYADYLELQEFYAVEPWGVAVQDAMQANLASIMANVNRDSKKRPTPYALSDFLIFGDPQQERHAAPEDPVRVNGLTAEQHKLLMGFEALQRKFEAEKAQDTL
jgi:hypothetical protein